jgi:hypothetical protein
MKKTLNGQRLTLNSEPQPVQLGVGRWPLGVGRF